MSHELAGKRALVGGGSKGIGLGCGIALANAGAQVTLMARSAQLLEDAVTALQGDGHGFIVADTAEWETMRDLVAADIEARGPVHILVHNTGGPPPGPAIDADPDEFDTGFDTHLMSGQALAQVVVPGMRSEVYGRIINIISSSVVTPLPNLGVSNTIRGAVAQWGRTLASELAPYGITVNNVLPGSIDTSRLRATMQRISERDGDSIEDVEKSTIRAIPAGRLGAPQDIGAVVAFLASPGAEYVNGVNLPVDGAKTAIQ